MFNLFITLAERITRIILPSKCFICDTLYCLLALDAKSIIDYRDSKRVELIYSNIALPIVFVISL